MQEKGRVVLSMLTQNTGLFPAKNVRANLYMHDSFETAGSWEQTIPDIMPANTELNTYGGTSETLWDLTAPQISKGQSTYPFTFLVDLSYDYESSGFREIPILKYERVLQLKQANTPLSHGQETYLNGPLSVAINVDDPVILKEKDKTFTIKVVLSLSEGYIKGPSGGDCGPEPLDCVDSVKLELPPDITVVSGEDLEEKVPNCAFDASGEKKLVKLVEGKTAVLSCKLEVKKDAEEYNPTIKVKATYRHHVRGEAPVTVKK